MTVQQCDHCKAVMQANDKGMRDGKMTQEVRFNDGHESGTLEIVLKSSSTGGGWGDKSTPTKHDYCQKCLASLVTTGALPKITATR